MYYISWLAWVFIKGGCSRRGVQWMGVVLYNKLVYNIIQITTPCFHCTPLCGMQIARSTTKGGVAAPRLRTNVANTNAEVTPLVGARQRWS